MQLTDECVELLEEDRHTQTFMQMMARLDIIANGCIILMVLLLLVLVFHFLHLVVDVDTECWPVIGWRQQ